MWGACATMARFMPSQTWKSVSYTVCLRRFSIVENEAIQRKRVKGVSGSVFLQLLCLLVGLLLRLTQASQPGQRLLNTVNQAAGLSARQP